MTVQIAPIQKYNPSYLKTKRVLEVLFKLLILIPLCITIVIVAIIIRLDSPGPIFYRQKRTDLHGVEFYIYKFRSTYVNSDSSLHRDVIVKYINGQEINIGTAAAIKFQFKLSDDPRVTRVGRFIRKTSIDELPQFFNVLRGEMTLVGPRPPLPYEVEYYTSHDWLRLSGRPGLTGIWRVSGRSRVNFQSMVEMDIEYLQHQSFWEDLKLIALTIPVMIQGRGGA